jgi:hypothetical protein
MDPLLRTTEKKAVSGTASSNSLWKISEATLPARKVMVTVFWGCGRDFLVDIVRRGQTINSDLYIRILKTQEKRFRRVGHHRNISEVH